MKLTYKGDLTDRPVFLTGPRVHDRAYFVSIPSETVYDKSRDRSHVSFLRIKDDQDV